MFEHDLGEFIVPVHALDLANAVADSVTDNVAVNGATVNRRNATTGGVAKSGVAIVTYSATLSAAESVTLTVALQESTNGSSWDTAETLTSSTVTDDDAGGTYTGIVEANVDFTGRKQYVRLVVTPDLSQADIPEVLDPPTPAVEATDTVSFSGVWVFGGYQFGPV